MERLCLVCKKPLIKRDHESAPRFAKKKFCSSACARIQIKSEGRGWYAHNTLKNRLDAQYEKEQV